MLVPFKKAAPDATADPSADVAPARRGKRVARLVAILALLLCAGGGGAIWWASDGDPGLQYQLVPAAEGPLVARVTANGALAARVTVQVGSQVSGRIQEILVDFNSTVTKGQVLARLDPALFRATVAQARANLTAALGNLAKVRARARNAAKILKRAQVLVERDLIAGAEVDTAEAEAAAGRGDIAAAQGDVAQTRAALQQAQVNLAYTTIVSPVNGTVISRNVDVGQTVAASLQAPTLFTIAEDLRAMQVHTSVPEADIGRLKTGIKATFTVDAYPDEKWQGVIREVRNAAQINQNVVTYDAVVDVDNEGARLRPGMTATVSFVYAEKAHAVAIPNAALRYRPKHDSSAAAAGEPAGRGGWRPVYVLVNGSPVRRLVRLGISNGKLTEVVQGEIAAGDQVITDDKKGEGKHEGGRRLPSKL
ncbi:MAG TPA: efflux RND transporter periplasmic adaptor subunit [Polyangia bacterium]|jgi:HlyD family secretion protein|nr:efflux RND transporter periplasmic adaptor subunit [Polyangia bacterium]